MPTPSDHTREPERKPRRPVIAVYGDPEKGFTVDFSEELSSQARIDACCSALKAAAYMREAIG